MFVDTKRSVLYMDSTTQRSCWKCHPLGWTTSYEHAYRITMCNINHMTNTYKYGWQVEMEAKMSTPLEPFVIMKMKKEQRNFPLAKWPPNNVGLLLYSFTFLGLPLGLLKPLHTRAKGRTMGVGDSILSWALKHSVKWEWTMLMDHGEGPLYVLLVEREGQSKEAILWATSDEQ